MDIQAQDFLKQLRKITKLKQSFWITEQEAEILISRLNNSEAPVYVESGTCHGFSTCWAASTNVEQIHTFDPVKREQIWERPELKRLVPKITFHLAEFDKQVSTVLKHLNNVKVFYFIDGNHSLTGVSKDLNAIVPFLKKNDVILFHDSMTAQGVVRIVNRIPDKFPTWIKTDFKTDRGMTEFIIG